MTEIRQRLHRIGGGWLILCSLLLLAGSGFHHHELITPTTDTLRLEAFHSITAVEGACLVCKVSQNLKTATHSNTTGAPLTESQPFQLEAEVLSETAHLQALRPRGPPPIPSHDA